MACLVETGSEGRQPVRERITDRRRSAATLDTDYYLDGLQLFSYACIAYKVEPWSLDRVDILRGPASALYSGAGSGGRPGRGGRDGAAGLEGLQTEVRNLEGMMEI